MQHQNNWTVIDNSGKVIASGIQTFAEGLHYMKRGRKLFNGIAKYSR